MFKLYQAALRSVFSDDASKNIKDGPLSIMGSKYSSNSAGTSKLIALFKDNYLKISDKSKIGLISSHISSPSSIPVVQLIGMHLLVKETFWTKIDLSRFNGNSPLVPIDFSPKTKPDGSIRIILIMMEPTIEVYMGEFDVGIELCSFLRTISVQPSKSLELDNYEVVYNHLRKHGLGVYHTEGTVVDIEGFISYDFFDEISINVSLKSDNDDYAIGEYKDNMLVYNITNSQNVQKNDIIEQTINGDQFVPSVLIYKMNVKNIGFRSIDDPSSYRVNHYYIIPSHLIKEFKR